MRIFLMALFGVFLVSITAVTTYAVGVTLMPSDGGIIDNTSNSTECVSDPDCGWCGNKCIPYEPMMICPAVMPPSGYDCACVDGTCDEVESGQVIGIPIVTPVNITIGVDLNIEAEIIPIDTFQTNMSLEANYTPNGTIIIIPPCMNYTIVEINHVKEIPSPRPPCTKYQLKSITMEKAKSMPAIPQNTSFPSTGKVKGVSVFSGEYTQIIKAQISSGDEETDDVEIERTGNKILIRSNGVEAETDEDSVELEASGIYIKSGDSKKEVRVLPDSVKDILDLKGIEVKEMKLKIIEQETVYEVEGESTGMFLGIFPVTLQVETSIVADTGEIGDVIKPWWSFLVF